MTIGKYIIRKAKTIKKKLMENRQGSNDDVIRMLQIYNCRFLGICFYRIDTEFNNDRKTIVGSKKAPEIEASHYGSIDLFYRQIKEKYKLHRDCDISCMQQCTEGGTIEPKCVK